MTLLNHLSFHTHKDTDTHLLSWFIHRKQGCGPWSHLRAWLDVFLFRSLKGSGVNRNGVMHLRKEKECPKNAPDCGWKHIQNNDNMQSIGGGGSFSSRWCTESMARLNAHFTKWLWRHEIGFIWQKACQLQDISPPIVLRWMHGPVLNFPHLPHSWISPRGCSTPLWGMCMCVFVTRKV